MPSLPPSSRAPDPGRTAVLLSGGVDSSVALHRVLDRASITPTAFYLKIWLEDELSFLGHCPWEEDLHYARQVCQAAGVKLEIVPLQRRYHELVVEWALGELRAGRTPSPDILCNQRVKFGAFFDFLDELGEFDTIASGHYARLRRDESGKVHLLRGLDPVKDQTYFLHELDQGQLSRAAFPIGDMTKAEVRRQAERLRLCNRSRPDSQGICFLGKIRFDDFVRAHLGDRPGPIRSIHTGETLGEHRGHWFHTIGQRKGLGLGGGPWYVVAKEVETDTVYIAHKDRLSDHRSSSFRVPSVHWIAERPEDGPVGVRIRHGPRMAEGVFETSEDGGLRIRLAEADPGVAAGQAAVLYRGETCLGGGQITLLSTHPDPPMAPNPYR